MNYREDDDSDKFCDICSNCGAKCCVSCVFALMDYDCVVTCQYFDEPKAVEGTKICDNYMADLDMREAQTCSDCALVKRYNMDSQYWHRTEFKKGDKVILNGKYLCRVYERYMMANNFCHRWKHD